MSWLYTMLYFSGFFPVRAAEGYEPVTEPRGQQLSLPGNIIEAALARSLHGDGM